MNAPREVSDQNRQRPRKKRSRIRNVIAGIGLRPRLLSAFFLVSLVPLILLFCVQYQVTKRGTLTMIESSLVQVAEVQQRRINHELNRLFQQLQLVASRTQMRISLAAFNQTHEVKHLDLLTQILADARLSMDNFAGIWIRNPEDLLVTGVYDENSLVPPALAPPLLGTGEKRVELEWREDSCPLVWVSGPLLLGEETIGSVHILVTMKTIYAVLDDFPCEKVGGETVLLLRDADDRTRAFGQLCETKSQEFLRLLESSGLFEASGAAIACERPLYVEDQIVLMRSLDYAFGHVVVHLSTDSLTDAFWYQMRLLLLLLLLAASLILLMVLWLSRLIAQPLRRLTEVTSGLQDGASDVRIRERFWGEFTDLARSFNRAMRMLSKRTGELHQEIEARRRSQQKLVDLANTDTLTGLINRRFFMERLREVLSSPGRERQPAALLYLDLDDFKPINDRLGHEAGDLVLQVVAGRIRHLLREGDMAARLGGDEFALLLMKDGSHHLDPDMVARRVEEQLSMPMTVKNQVVSVGCSVGVVSLSPGDDPEEVLNRADQNMYRAKHARRDSGN